MLELEGVRIAHGSATAIWDVSLRIGQGELVCVVGPNGAGKTTLINAVAGPNRAAAGNRRMDGEDLVGLPSHRFCDRGIAIVPEGRRLFTGLSVRENLELGSYRKAARSGRAASLERVLEVFPALKERQKALAGTLSGGQQQMVAIGRALMAQPRLRRDGAPARGLGPASAPEWSCGIRDINRAGMAVLLVEQNVAMALELAARAYVLEEGRIAVEGSPGELLASPHIRRAYLGEA